MTNALTVFNFQASKVRTITLDDGLWFVAKDVLNVLGYSASSNAARTIAHVPAKWRGVNPIHTPSGDQEMHVLSEQGLYFFLGRSDKPLALPLQEFVAGEVLPAIRKTGSYSVAPRDPLSDIDRLIPAIASGMGEIRTVVEAQSNRLAIVEERQKAIDPQEIERRMRYLAQCKESLVNATKGKPQAVTHPGYWRELKGLIGINSFQNRAALTVQMMDRCVAHAQEWLDTRGVKAPTLFDVPANA